jgi:hypothetical protein
MEIGHGLLAAVRCHASPSRPPSDPERAPLRPTRLRHRFSISRRYVQPWFKLIFSSSGIVPSVTLQVSEYVNLTAGVECAILLLIGTVIWSDARRNRARCARRVRWRGHSRIQSGKGAALINRCPPQLARTGQADPVRGLVWPFSWLLGLEYVYHERAWGRRRW